MSMTIMWLLLFITFIVLELTTAMSLVSVWFALGAIAAMFAAKAGVAFVWQFIIFVFTSVVALILTKPFVQKLRPKREATNLDAIIGGVAIVTGAIDNVAEQGEVKVDGKYWTARSIDDSIIAVDEKVKIIRIQGVKVFVEKV